MNDMHGERNGALPAAINTDNPTPDTDACSIVALVKESGKISGYQLSNGQKVSREQGVKMAKDNIIKGVSIAHNQGTEYLRALPDGNQNNNLGNLPSVTV